MVEGYERSAIPLRLHNVLLALAGRLDDSALGQARRLAARARTDEAAELIIGSLVAGRIPVRAAEQRELAALLTAAGADDWVAEQLIIDEHHEVVQHRFSDGGGTAGAGVAEALQIVLQRLPDVRGVHAVWRNTVAGSVPGPMPQRLVLAEVGPAGSALATAYRMDTALRRAGIAAAVEVTDTGAARDGYHGMALAAADLVVSGPAEVADTYPPVYPEETPSPEPAPERYEPEPEPEPEPAPEPAPEAVEPEPVREPEPEPDPEPPTQPEPVLPEQYSVRPWTTGLPPINVVEQTGGSELEPGELFWPQSEPSAGGSAQPAPAARPEVPEETRAEQTTELTPSELGLLRSAIAAGKPAEQTTITQPAEETMVTGAAEPTKITGADSPTHVTEPADVAGRAMEFPANDLDNPRLSVRDRELLRELHAELAKRERDQASQVRLNGWEPGAAR